MKRRELLLGTFAALALLPASRAFAAEPSASVGPLRLKVTRVIYPADPAGFSLGYWNHDVIAAVELTLANTGPGDVVFRRSQLAPPPRDGTSAFFNLIDSAGRRVPDVPPFDEPGGLEKRAGLLWAGMAHEPPNGPSPGDPLLKTGASASGWLYFVVPDGDAPAWLELTLSNAGQANVDLREAPTQQVDPSAYASLNAQRAAYRPDLEPKVLVVPPDQMPGVWESRPSSLSSGLGQVDATYHDLSDLGRSGRAARFVVRDRKTEHDADVEVGRRATTFASFADAQLDQIDGLGDGLAFRVLFQIGNLAYVLYGFRVDRFSVEVSAFQPGTDAVGLQDVLDAVVGLQIERIRSAIASTG